MSFVVHVFAFVDSSILPFVDTSSVQLVVLPASNVHAAVCPSVGAVSVDGVIFQLPFIGGVVGPLEAAFAFLQSLDEISLEQGSIGPCLLPFAVLLVLDPVAFVFGSIYVFELTVAVSLIILPIAFIDVSIRVNHTAFSIGSITFPIAFEYSAIFEGLDAFSVYRIRLVVPLPFILVARFQDNKGSGFLLYIWLFFLLHVKDEFRQLLPNFLDFLSSLDELRVVLLKQRELLIELRRLHEAVSHVDLLPGEQAPDSRLHFDQVERVHFLVDLLDQGHRLRSLNQVVRLGV